MDDGAAVAGGAVGGGGGFGPCRHIHDTDTRIDCVIYIESIYYIYIQKYDSIRSLPFDRCV